MNFSDIQSHWDELLILIGAIGVACEGTIAALLVLVRALRALAGSLGGVALLSHTLTDDHIIGRLVAALDGASRGLERAQRIIPRLRTGERRGEAQARPVDPRGTAMLGVLLIGASALLGGCAGRALVAADGARAAACIQVERQCVDRYEAGNLTATGAEACVSCTRSTCDAIRERIAAGGE